MRRAVSYLADLVNLSKAATGSVQLKRAKGFDKVLDTLQTYGYVLSHQSDLRTHKVEIGALRGYYHRGWTHGVSYSAKKLRALYHELHNKHRGILIYTSDKGITAYTPLKTSGGKPLVYVY